MRKLKTSDIFAFARVIRASGIRSDLTAFVQRISNDKNVDRERIGIDTILMVVEALVDKKAEAAIYEALAPVMEMTPAELEDLPPAELFQALKQLAAENDLESFFGSALRTLGSN